MSVLSDSIPNSNIHQIWENCLTIIRDSVHAQSFKTWFKPILPIKIEGKNLTVQLPSQFFYEWLEEHYPDLIKRAISQTMGEEAKLIFSIVVNDRQEFLKIPAFSSPKKAETTSVLDFDSQLNQRYTFENFVEGSSNQFAKAAALAVAEAPAKTSFNPLVIYGGTGLGKTHLVQAIGNFARTQGSAKRILYVSSEKFTIEFINAIQNNKTSEFSKLYRNVDLLLVDDIQFFSNKERTQEEFFHTFNEIHQNGKQIVLTSDRPPRDIKGLEERLLSRFQWGLVTDIQPPDLETRIAILQKRAEEDGIDVPTEVTLYIAENVTSNIRELEGSLIRLLAHSSLNGSEITLDLAKKLLKDIAREEKKTITVESIQKIVSDHYKLPEDLLRAKTRKQEVVLARQVAMYLSKELTKHSLKTIGLHFGGRDHSTVIHACNTVESLMAKDAHLKNDIELINKKIQIAH